MSKQTNKKFQAPESAGSYTYFYGHFGIAFNSVMCSFPHIFFAILVFLVWWIFPIELKLKYCGIRFNPIYVEISNDLNFSPSPTIRSTCFFLFACCFRWNLTAMTVFSLRKIHIQRTHRQLQAFVCCGTSLNKRNSIHWLNKQTDQQ